jgi:hypothetical protein
MEKMMIVKKSLPMRRVNLGDRESNCKGLLLSDGIDTVLAEAWGDQASNLESIAEGDELNVWVQLTVGESTKDGQARYFNRARIVDFFVIKKKAQEAPAF